MVGIRAHLFTACASTSSASTGCVKCQLRQKRELFFFCSKCGVSYTYLVWSKHTFLPNLANGYLGLPFILEKVKWPTFLYWKVLMRRIWITWIQKHNLGKKTEWTIRAPRLVEQDYKIVWIVTKEGFGVRIREWGLLYILSVQTKTLQKFATKLKRPSGSAACSWWLAAVARLALFHCMLWIHPS